MKVKCLFGHKFGEWQKADEYLERRCLRCGKQEVVFPSWQAMVIEEIVRMAGLLIIAKRKNLPKR